MGMRLQGPRLAHRSGADIVSDGIANGAVQVPGSGQPIILLADRQTAGGYTKIATVISADLPRLGRMRPGETLSFAPVGVAAAEAIRRSQEATLARLFATLPEARPAGGLDLDALYAGNLIDGVVDALNGPGRPE